jgi:phospholipid transport system substrate-binding protein
MIARRSVLAAVAALTALGMRTGNASAANPDAAKAFVKSLADEAIALMAQRNTTSPAQQARFRELFTRGFDVEEIGRFVLGRYWREATDTERAEYLKLFEDLIVSTYASRFSEYSGEKLTVLDARADDDRTVIVVSQIERPGGQPAIRLDWRLVENGSRFRITDVVIEAVSMSVAQRSEFASVIQRGGGRVESLLAALRAKTRTMR